MKSFLAVPGVPTTVESRGKILATLPSWQKAWDYARREYLTGSIRNLHGTHFFVDGKGTWGWGEQPH